MHSCLLMIGHVLDFIVIVLTRIAEVNKNGKIKRLWDWFLWGLRHHPRPEPCSPPAWFYWFLGQSFIWCQVSAHLWIRVICLLSFFWDLGSNSLWSEASRCVGRNPATKAGSHLSVQWRTLTILIVCSMMHFKQSSCRTYLLWLLPAAWSYPGVAMPPGLTTPTFTPEPFT